MNINFTHTNNYLIEQTKNNICNSIFKKESVDIAINNIASEVTKNGATASEYYKKLPEFSQRQIKAEIFDIIENLFCGANVTQNTTYSNNDASVVFNFASKIYEEVNKLKIVMTIGEKRKLPLIESPYSKKTCIDLTLDKNLDSLSNNDNSTTLTNTNTILTDINTTLTNINTPLAPINTQTTNNNNLSAHYFDQSYLNSPSASPTVENIPETMFAQLVETEYFENNEEDKAIMTAWVRICQHLARLKIFQWCERPCGPLTYAKKQLNQPGSFGTKPYTMQNLIMAIVERNKVGQTPPPSAQDCELIYTHAKRTIEGDGCIFLIVKNSRNKQKTTPTLHQA